jgi:trans-2,3-dihydro-3-hydroxyanthranilate isomerase
MMSESDKGYRYQLVDVFTKEPLLGNQLAVFTDGRGLNDRSMQRIARELNLPEVTFVLPATLPGCVADVRIFTPSREMVFAGHPTIGTAYVLRSEGLVARDLLEFNVQEKVGAVPVRVGEGDNPLLWLRTPPIRWSRTYDPALCAQVLGLSVQDLWGEGIAPQRLSAGNPTLFVPLRNVDAVDRAALSSEGMAKLRGDELDAFCVFVFTPTATGAYSRMFAPEYGIVEDPGTGSATGPLAAYMRKHALQSGTRYFSEQGTRMGRRSLLHVQIQDSGDIDVGGHVTAIGEGILRLS